MLKTIIFDIDNTLYSYNSAHKRAFSVLSQWALSRLGLSETAFLALHQEGDRLLRAHTGRPCAAIHNRLIRYQLMLEHIGQPISHAPVMAELYWSTLLENMEISSGAQECFATLKAQGYVIGIGTDMTADYQFAKLERLGLLGYVDFMVSSEEAGTEKPDVRLFALCAQKAGCPAEECVFVGDSLKKDVAGAKNAGMLPVWFCPDKERAVSVPEGTVRIQTLSELPTLLLNLK